MSIGLPIFNGEKYIKSALDSLLSQTHENIEIIISDNASTDATEIICREYQKSDSRIHYVRNSKNIGMPRNFNQVFEHSRGKYFMWAAYDDLWDPTYIEKCVDKLETNSGAIVCYSHIDYIDAIGNPYEISGHVNPSIPIKRDTVDLSLVDRVLSSGWFFYGMYRSALVRKTRLVTETFLSDFVFGLEVSLVGDLIKVDEVLMSYRIAGGRSNEDILNLLWSDGLEKERFRKTPWTEGTRDLMNVLNIFDLDGTTKNELGNLLSQHLAIVPAFRESILAENKFLWGGNSTDIAKFIRSLLID